MLYQEFLEELESYSDENYREFHKRLLKNDNINVLGVRVPQLRKLAKKYSSHIEVLLSFPDEFYEVTFVKLTAVSFLSYEEFIRYSDECVKLIDNWATCDCFVPKCVAKHKDEFIEYIEKYSSSAGEFYQRFALTTLLHFYVEDKYFDFLIKIIEKSDTEKYYYVHMAAAWLIAEMLIKNYESAKNYLLKGALDKKTHNKAIQKAVESLRLSDGQKNFLKGIKR